MNTDVITHGVDSQPAADIPLRPGESVLQCSKCGRRIITASGDQAPGVCGCSVETPVWIAVREKHKRPDPASEAIVDVCERWPVDSEGARTFLDDVGFRTAGDSL